MPTTHCIVEGMVTSEGTLTLDSKLSLPPGRVQVIVQCLVELPQTDPFWQMIEQIRAAQKARNHVPRTVEEIEAERSCMRNEWEERMQRIQQLQEQTHPSRTNFP